MPTDAKVLLFQTLADPTRLAIFEHLSQGESTVTAISRRFPVSQPAVSQHLAALYRCKLVSRRREGRTAVYKAAPQGLDPLNDWLHHYRTFWPQRLDSLKALLETPHPNKGDTP